MAQASAAQIVKQLLMQEFLCFSDENIWKGIKWYRPKKIVLIPCRCLRATKYFVPIKKTQNLGKKEGKVHPFTGTEALYRPYSP